MTKPILPTDAAARKAVPIATGFVDYFPDAIAAIAAVSKVGGEQHNPGKPLFWDRTKSQDEADTLMRHFLERGTIDTDGQRHSAKVAWRALALLQKEIEAEREAQAEVYDGRPLPMDATPLDHELYSRSPQWSEEARKQMLQAAYAEWATRAEVTRAGIILGAGDVCGSFTPTGDEDELPGNTASRRWAD